MDDKPQLIVILEDDASMRRAIERLLRLSGFTTRTFAYAEESGLEEACSAALCLVVDIQLPGISGPLFYMTLREPRPPAVFITAFEGPATQQALAAVGKHALVKKPFLGKELLAAVSSATSPQC